MSLAAITALYREFGQTWKNKRTDDDNKDEILDALLPYLLSYYPYASMGKNVTGGDDATGIGQEEGDLDFL